MQKQAEEQHLSNVRHSYFTQQKVHQCTLSPYVRCGVNDDSTSHAVKLRKEDVERNSKINNRYYDDLGGNCLESLRFTCTVVNILDLRGGTMSSLASVTSHLSRDRAVKNMRASLK